MKKIKITVEINQNGGADINIIPSTYGQWSTEQSDSKEYELEPGEYTLTYGTLTQGGGRITVEGETGVLITFDFASGEDGGNIGITIV